ncbi:MAG: thiamine pyrophosphate-dependent enzyme [Patescibacteria group bacterium]
MAINEGIKDKQFKVPIHLAMGHESIAVAVNNIMSKNDKLILSHRNIAYNLARSHALKAVWDEYALKSNGLNQGKSGSMNLANPKEGIIYTSSILGNNFPVATGVAMAEQMRSDKNLTVVLGGDGSMEEGSFYESLVMAKTLGLSILFIIENNNWSLATRIKERRCQIDLAALAGAVGIKYVKLTGNDPYKYMVNLKKLRSYTLSKKSPVCIEVDITTLGDWRGAKTPQYPKGKFINYHAGAAPNVSFDRHPIIKKDASDPVFVIKKYINAPMMNKIRNLVSKDLKQL